MDPSLHSSPSVDNRVGPFNMATGVVLPQRLWRLIQNGKKNVLRKELAELYQNFQVPFVDNGKALYRLPWILAVVDG